MPNNAHPAYLTVVTHPLPTLSCFIPSLPHGCPFRVSLHSWQIPVASRATVSLAPQESMIGFEAKVLLDGKVTACVPVTGGYLGSSSRWMVEAPCSIKIRLGLRSSVSRFEDNTSLISLLTVVDLFRYLFL